MKILLSIPRPLLPADTGGKIRSLQIFSRLAKRAEVHAISQADPELDTDVVEEMRRMFASYTPVYWKETPSNSRGFYIDVVKNQLSPLPYFIAKFCRPQFMQALQALAESHRFDLLLSDFLQTATTALDLPIRPRVIFQHNVEYLLRQRKWQTENMPLKKWVFAAEWKKTQRIEARVCRSFDHVIAVSEEDRRTFEQEFGVHHVSTIPTGVDGEYFCPQAIPPKSARLVFVGSMDWYPNEDGVTWFLHEVYPRIRRDVPAASLTIVGRRPSSRLKAVAMDQPGVTLTGRVMDVRPYLAEAEVVVVPLRVGGGTRIKIPEAMAMGKAVVSTRIGAEGLPFHDGREIMLQDDPEKFARDVTALLRDASRREAIASAARKRVVRDHNWESVVDCMEEILGRVRISFGTNAAWLRQPGSQPFANRDLR